MTAEQQKAIDEFVRVSGPALVRAAALMAEALRRAAETLRNIRFTCPYSGGRDPGFRFPCPVCGKYPPPCGLGQ